MTISSTLNRVSTDGNGATTTFPVSFPFHNQADLVVLSTVIATGVQTVKALTTDYTIDGVIDPNHGYSAGGSVEFLIAPASTERITIYRDPIRKQLLDLIENDNLPAEAVEAQFDYLTMLVQRVSELISRSLHQPDGDSTSIGELPAAVERALKYLSFDSNGDPIAASVVTPGSLTVSSFIETLLDDANATTARDTLGAAAKQGISTSDYGVVGDGTTNDTTALASAIAAAAGDHLYIPAGTYKLPFSGASALTPPANCVIEGAGIGITTLRFEPDSTTLRSFFNCTAGGLTLRNLSISCVVPSTGVVLFFALDSNGLHLEHVDCDGGLTNVGAVLSHTAHMIAVDSTGTHTDISITHCTVHRFNYGFLKASAYTSTQRRISAHDCDFYGNYNEDWSFNNPNGTLEDVQVIGCRFRDGAGAAASLTQLHCAFASVDDFSVQGCTFEGVVGDAIHIEENCLGGSITGNTINVDGTGVYLSDNDVGGSDLMPRYITISGNTIRKAGTPAAVGPYGINIVTDGSPEVPGINIVVQGNIVYGYDTGLISGATLDDACVIADNIFAECTIGMRIDFGNFSVYNNTTHNCNKGVYNDSFGTIARHTFIGCTTNADANSRPFVLVDPVFIFPEFAVGAGSTTYKNLAALGANDRAHGHLNISVTSNVIADRSSRRDEITWDGASFTSTNKLVEAPGAITVTSERNASLLAVKIVATNALTAVVVQAHLTGMVVVAP